MWLCRKGSFRFLGLQFRRPGPGEGGGLRRVVAAAKPAPPASQLDDPRQDGRSVRDRARAVAPPTLHADRHLFLPVRSKNENVFWSCLVIYRGLTFAFLKPHAVGELLWEVGLCDFTQETASGWNFVMKQRQFL